MADRRARTVARRRASEAAALLAAAAMRSRDTGLAALRAGQVEACNRRWRTLASPGPRPWMPATEARDAPPSGPDGAGDGSYPTLDALALSEAAALLAAGARVRVARVQRPGSERSLEVRLERAGRSRREPVVLATAVDVTAQVRQLRELERMREALHQQERLRTVGELASGVAHDLNNALHALLLRLAPLRQPGALPPLHRENAERIAHIASEAAARVQRLEDLARRREDRPDERADLVEVVAGAVRLLRAELAAPEAGRPPVTLTTRLPPAAVVRGSPPELRQVLTGLLLNAREAMPAGGTIRVAVRRDRAAPGAVWLTVSDEGTGVAPAHLPRLFDPFFTTKGRRGSGLGLAIAHGVMRRLGGDIQAANRRAGGAVFTLRFPALEPHPAAPEPPARDGALRRLPPRRVLVVDDDEDNLEAARLVLQALGQHVEVAASGRDAVDRVRAGERYDLVLTDLGMPGLGGWEVAAEVGALTPRARIYVVTGWAHELALDDPRRGRVAGVLAKPLSVEALVQVVRGAPEPAEAARGPPAGPVAT